MCPDDTYWMERAIACAQRGESEGEVPVGAVLVMDNKLIAEGFNQPISKHDPSAHAEMNVLRLAGQIVENYRLSHATLYVTLEPCLMCAGAMLHARIARCVYATPDPKTGAIDSVHQILSHSKNNHRIEVTRGVCQAQASELLKQFFKQKRVKRVEHDYS